MRVKQAVEAANAPLTFRRLRRRIHGEAPPQISLWAAGDLYEEDIKAHGAFSDVGFGVWRQHDAAPETQVKFIDDIQLHATLTESVHR